MGIKEPKRSQKFFLIFIPTFLVSSVLRTLKYIIYIIKKIQKSKLSEVFLPRDHEKRSKLGKVQVIRVKHIRSKNVEFIRLFDGTEEIGQS